MSHHLFMPEPFENNARQYGQGGIEPPLYPVFPLSPQQETGHAASILLVTNTFKRSDVEMIYQLVRENLPTAIPTIERIRSANPDIQVFTLIGENFHLSLYWFEHLSYQMGRFIRCRDPYAFVLKLGEEYHDSMPVLLPSFKAILMARILQAGMPQAAFKYYDFFDHHLGWLTDFPYRCQYPEKESD